jgi:tripartite-type tricarboxylate transporter receptor subunit TctC
MIKNIRCAAAMAALTTAAVAVAIPSAYADAPYPSRPITLVVPFTPGGSTDIIARLLSRELGATFHQSVIVENKPGAGGIVGTQFVKAAAPDGYTLVVGAIGTFGANATMYTHLPYDPVKDFAPISLVASVPNVLAVNPKKLNIHSVAELVQAARAQPNKLEYASGGQGSAANLAMEYFKLRAGVQILHVPYKGTAPALTDLVGGVTSVVLTGLPPLYPFFQSDRLRPIAVASAKRQPLLPNVPTIAESSGFEGFQADQWYGLLTVAGTPQPIVDSLNKAVVAMLQKPDVLAIFKHEGLEPMADTPQEFGNYIKDQIQLWGPVVKKAGIVIE